MSSLEGLLLHPVEEWTVDQVIVFDWYDGPRQGVASLAHPRCEFVFDLIAEKPNPDDLDDRYFRLKELPLGSVQKVAKILEPLGTSTAEVWVPLWQFSSAAEERAAEEKINQQLAKAIPSDIVVCSREMLTYLGCWNIADEAVKLPELLAQVQHSPL